MNLIEEMVTSLLRRHKDGGTEYFNALDKTIGDTLGLVSMLLFSVPFYRPIAMQGKFGNTVHELLASWNIEHMWPGFVHLVSSPRQEEEAEMVHYGVLDTNPIFIDDSTYSGATIEGVDNVLEKQFGLNVHKTHVIYDGSPPWKKNSVSSLYRFYDYCPNRKDK